MREWKKLNSAEKGLVGYSLNLVISAEEIANFTTGGTEWSKIEDYPWTWFFTFYFFLSALVCLLVDFGVFWSCFLTHGAFCFSFQIAILGGTVVTFQYYLKLSYCVLCSHTFCNQWTHVPGSGCNSQLHLTGLVWGLMTCRITKSHIVFWLLADVSKWKLNL